MGKLLLIILVLPVFCLGDVEKLGEWTILAMSPRVEKLKYGCIRVTLEYEDAVTFECDNGVTHPEYRANLNVFKTVGEDGSEKLSANVTQYFKVINNSQELDVYKFCSSESIRNYLFSFARFIADNFILLYSNDQSSNTLLGRLVLTAGEMRRIMESDEELKSKDMQLLCYNDVLFVIGSAD